MPTNGRYPAAYRFDGRSAVFGIRSGERLSQHVQVGFKEQCTVVQQTVAMDVLGVAGKFEPLDGQIITSCEFGGDAERGKRGDYRPGEVGEIVVANRG